MKIIPSDTVALAGFAGYPQIKKTILEYLDLHHINYTTLSPKIKALIVGPTISNDLYKIQYSKLHNIPTITVNQLYEITSDEQDESKGVLWVDKYKPTRISNIIGNSEVIKELYNWLKKWKPDTKPPNALLITGPPGIGKTSSVNIVANFAGYTVIDCNASDQRSAKSIKQMFDETFNSRYIGQKFVCIMDEVDGMSSGDMGGMSELIKVIDKCPPFPIICIANDRNHPKVRSLASHCIDVKYNRPSKVTIAKEIYATICVKEKITISLKALEEICENNGNDIRQIINHLQFASSSVVGKMPAKDEVLRLDLFDVTSKLFGNSGTLHERIDYTFVDANMVPLMIQENYISAAKSLNTIVKASQYMSMWDMIDSRVHTQQAWQLMPDACSMVVGAAGICRGHPSMQAFPKWLGKNSKTGKHKRNITDIMHRTGYSAMSEYYDFIDAWKYNLYALNDAESVCNKLESLKLTRDDMLETLSEFEFETMKRAKDNKMPPPPDSKLKAAITREWRKRHPLNTVSKSKDESDDEEEECD